jgi:ribosomal protein S18 acetylase RimI-like enzyme
MNIVIEEVKNARQLREFIDFPIRLYRDSPYYVPALRFDEKRTLRKDKNPAFDHCEARYWLAYKQGRVVGRIAGIWNKAYIDKWSHRYMRFGWMDFEEDQAIVRALIGEVEAWARELQMTAVHGPMGFTDLDHEGMLVEGFDLPGTLATIYNHSYYPDLLEKAGYRKDVDWVEYRIKVPENIPAELERVSALVEQRFRLHLVKARRAKDILPYAKEIFDLINTTYAHLYGVVPLTDRQVRYYTQQYFSFIRTDFVPLIIDEKGKLIAFGITMPSLTVALQKAKGSLFPLGFSYVLRALKKNDVADLYLVAVDKAWQGRGVVAMLMREVTKTYIANGIKYAESNPELETNRNIRTLWEHYEVVQHKRRRSFIKFLNTH